MTVNTEDIYRAMGYRWKTGDQSKFRWWSASGQDLDLHECNAWEMEHCRPANALRDPLTDWSAFGEIMEWADRWTDEHDYRLNIMRTWEWIDGRSQRCYDVTVTLGRSMLSRSVHADFRTAVLAALSEAVRE